MAETDIDTRIAGITALMHARLRAHGHSLRAALGGAGRQLPRRIRRQARRLAEAEPFAHHPKLRLTLDAAALSTAASEVEAHLNAIDLADRRKGWWLGMLGGMVFNVLAAFALLVVFLRWRGFV